MRWYQFVKRICTNCGNMSTVSVDTLSKADPNFNKCKLCKGEMKNCKEKGEKL